MITAPSRRRTQPPAPLKIETFKGIDLRNTIDLSYSQDAPNMILDDEYKPEKRTGYKRIFSGSVTGGVTGVFTYRKIGGQLIKLFTADTKLYSWNVEGVDPTVVYNGLSGLKTRTFVMNDKLYIMDGNKIRQYDGTTIADITTIAYKPILTQGRTASGGGDPLEQWNLIGSGFREKFSVVATDRAYPLSVTNLDEIAVTATINGVAKTENVDFTVNRTTGVVTFNEPPPLGTNNVEITAYKTMSGYANQILKCKYAILFGGANDTKVFLWGNPDYPNRIYRSGTSAEPPLASNPLYFPENYYQDIGSSAEKIMNCAKQYDTLVVDKESSIWSMGYDYNNGEPIFTVKPINDSVGLFSPDTLQVINNNPTGLTRNGVYMLTGGSVRDERNVQHISAPVDKLLLAEANLDQAVAIDYDKKYIISVNSNAYVYDYAKDAWYIWNNIPASCFCEVNGRLHFGDRSQGLVYRWLKKDEQYAYVDDINTITAYWTMIFTSFGYDNWYKIVPRLHYTLKPGSKTSCQVSYNTESRSSGVVSTSFMNQFDFNNTDFTNYTFVTNNNPQPETVTISDARKVIYFQSKFMNNKYDESFGIASIDIEWDLQSEVK